MAVFSRVPQVETKSNLNIVVALQCEARPLIDYFQLKKITNLAGTFSIYTNKANSIHLIIAGVGKINCAAATTYIQMITGNIRSSTFLNVGVAGSGLFPVGELLLAHKIIDQNTQRAWYPHVTPLRRFKKTVLMTHDRAQTSYPAEGMVDMEGAAFFQVANYFVSQEHIQILKIISDNDFTSLANINETTVKNLITTQLPQIKDVIDYLSKLSLQENVLELPPEKFTDFVNNWHFTHAQQLQLKEHLRRWKMIEKSIDPFEFSRSEQTAAAVLYKLTNQLNTYANCLS